MLYEIGDEIPGIGKIEGNHCGLPYVAGLKGLYMGTVQVTGHNEKGNSIFCDMRTGKRLTDKEMKKRLNNKKFDYLKIFK